MNNNKKPKRNQCPFLNPITNKTAQKRITTDKRQELQLCMYYVMTRHLDNRRFKAASPVFPCIGPPKDNSSMP